VLAHGGVGAGQAQKDKKIEESEGVAFVVFWLLREVQNRLIFNNSGMMKVVCWRRGGCCLTCRAPAHTG